MINEYFCYEVTCIENQSGLFYFYKIKFKMKQKQNLVNSNKMRASRAAFTLKMSAKLRRCSANVNKNNFKVVFKVTCECVCSHV